MNKSSKCKVVKRMVYCTKCGAKNPDEAEICAQCGTRLYRETEAKRHRKHDDECFEPEAECFGIPKGGAIVGIAIGMMILLSGLIWFLQQAELIPKTVEFWPFALIIFGILIMMGAFYGLRRRY